MKLNSDAEPIKVDPLPYPPMQLNAPCGDGVASEMTKREAYALGALQGVLCAAQGLANVVTNVALAVRYADTLLAELKE